MTTQTSTARKSRTVYVVEGTECPTLAAARKEAREYASHANPKIAIRRDRIGSDKAGPIVEWQCMAADGNYYCLDGK